MLKFYSQKILAQKLGITPAYVNQIIHGCRNASWNLAKRIGQLTTTPPDIWMDGELHYKRSLALLKAEMQECEKAYDI